MKRGVVSVLVCCYNGSRFISSCFDSLLSQKYKKLQVIFIDDGSTDGSYKRAEEYKNSFNVEGMDFICLRQTNQGAGYACSNGLLFAEGEYISCFDIDDYLFPDSIQKRVMFLENHPEYALVRTNGYKVYGDGRNKVLFVTESSEKSNEDIFEDLLLGRTNNWAGSYLIRSTALWCSYPNHRIPPSKYGQNLQILMPAAWHNKAGFIDEPLMEYRFNPNSFTNQGKDFESSYDRYLGYWQIRKDILSSMGLNDAVFQNKLALAYGKLILDLCILFDKRACFLEVYDSTSAIGPLEASYGYYYQLYKGNRIKALIVRFYGNKTFAEILRFCLVGVAATLIHYGIYLLLSLFLNYSIAYVIGYGISFIANYFLSSFFTFRKKVNYRTGLGFLGAHAFNLGFQSLLLNLFVRIGIKSNFAPIPVYAIAVPVNFLLVRFVFNKGQESKSYSVRSF